MNKFAKFFEISSLVALSILSSCSKDKDIEYRDIIVHDTITETETIETEKIIGYYTGTTPLYIHKKDTVVINYGDIEVGKVENDTVFDMVSKLLGPGGYYEEHTLNCSAFGSMSLKPDEDGTLVLDTKETPVTHTTLVNRGTITVHTKDLVEKYKDLIRTPDHPERKYEYFRIIVLFSGKNSKVVNEGVINVYFDHDPEIQSTIYVMGLLAGNGGEIINTGEINFYGHGSKFTRMRGVGTFADNLSIVNDGVIKAEVEVAEDSRGITTGGTYTNVVNNGTIDMKLPGTLYGITRFANNNIINNGKIILTSVDAPENYRLIVGQDITNPKNVAGLYDPINGNRQGLLSPMINRGTITINAESTQEEGLYAGMLFDVQSAVSQNMIYNYLDIHIENEGFITTTKKKVETQTAEAAFFTRNSQLCATISLGHWQTYLRDFANTKDLFYTNKVFFKYGASKFVLLPSENYEFGKEYAIDVNSQFGNIGTEAIKSFNIDDMEIVSGDSEKYKVYYDNFKVSLTSINTAK